MLANVGYLAAKPEFQRHLVAAVLLFSLITNGDNNFELQGGAFIRTGQKTFFCKNGRARKFWTNPMEYSK
mgnify:CR=1 FL=1